MELIEFKNYKGEILRGFLEKSSRSSIGVCCVHGFERSTTEYKFKNLADKLKGKADIFRFDFSGCGISDGGFEDITVKKHVYELERAVAIFKKKCPNIKNIVLIAHSFGCCAALDFMVKNKNVKRAVFFSPALNQKELQRFWFAVSKNPKKKITRQNFRRYFLEKDFQKDMKKPKRLSKAHYISNKYYLENKEADWRHLFTGLTDERILVIHGDKDDKVPLESNGKLPKNFKIIKIKGGDHDLQRQDMTEQYLQKAIGFILSSEERKRACAHFVRALAKQRV